MLLRSGNYVNAPKGIVVVLERIFHGPRFCHSLRVVHRDIKLENVLMDRNGLVKIIDFGSGAALPSWQLYSSFLSCFGYMLPDTSRVEIRSRVAVDFNHG